MIIFLLLRKRKIESPTPVFNFHQKQTKMTPIHYFLNLTRNEFCVFHNSIQVVKEIQNAVNDTNWLLGDNICVEADMTGGDFKYYTNTLKYKFIMRRIPMFDPEA